MATQAITPRTDHPLVQFQSQLAARAGEIKMALPSGISAEKFQRTVITAIQQNPDLLGGSRQSLILACMKAAQDGLLPDGREAALVTFNTRAKVDGDWKSIKQIQYMPMVYGLRKKILQAKDADGRPIVSALSVGVVYREEVERGYFLWERGANPEVQHRPMLDLNEEQASDANIVAAYSIATMSDGTISCEVMRRFEIDKVRQLSQTGSTGRVSSYGTDKGKPIPPKGPWVDWFPEMAKKTVMRRHSKTLPMSGDVILDLGREDDERDANMSTAALLGGTPGGDPQVIEDQSGERFDSVTGESQGGGHDAAQQQDESRGGDDNHVPVAKRRGRPPKAQQEKAQPTEGAPSGSKSEPDPGREASRAAAPSNEETADKLLADFAAAETVIDIERIYSAGQADRERMPDDLYDVIESDYSRHHRRLSGGVRKDLHPEPVQ